MQFGVANGGCGVWSARCGVSNGKFCERSVKCKVRSV